MIQPLFIIIITLILQSWVISPHNFFIFDDFSHFANSITHPIFTILPTHVYNDRPVGTSFIWLLFHTFGFSQQAHHIVLLFIHLLSAILVYFFVKKLVSIYKLNQPALPFITALFFANWPRSLFAIPWDAAIFDLLAVLFSLVFLNLSLIKKPTIFSKLLTILVFFIMLRTKESTVFVSAIPIAITLLKSKKIKLSDYNFSQIIPLFLGLFYVAYLFYLGKTGGFANYGPNNPYYTSISPYIIIRNFFRYIYLYFNLNLTGFIFSSFGKTGLIFTLAILVITTLLAFKNKLVTLALISTTICLLPVLPMVNMQHKLYLYLPSIFLSIIVSTIITSVISFLFKVATPVDFYIIFILFLTYANLINPIVLSEKQWWLDQGTQNQIAFNRLPHILQNRTHQTQIVFTNVDNPNNIFLYGPGHVLNAYFHNSNIKTTLIAKSHSTKIPTKNYCLVDYNHGNLSDIGCF